MPPELSALANGLEPLQATGCIGPHLWVVVSSERDIFSLWLSRVPSSHELGCSHLAGPASSFAIMVVVVVTQTLKRIWNLTKARFLLVLKPLGLQASRPFQSVT